MFFSIFPSLWLQALSSWSRVKLTDTLLELLPEIWIETEKLSRAWAVSFCWCLPKALSGSTDKQNEQNAPVKSRKITLMGLRTLGKLTTIKKNPTSQNLKLFKTELLWILSFSQEVSGMPIYKKTFKVLILAGKNPQIVVVVISYSTCMAVRGRQSYPECLFWKSLNSKDKNQHHKDQTGLTT